MILDASQTSALRLAAAALAASPSGMGPLVLTVGALRRGPLARVAPETWRSLEALGLVTWHADPRRWKRGLVDGLPLPGLTLANAGVLEMAASAAPAGEVAHA